MSRALQVLSRFLVLVVVVAASACCFQPAADRPNLCRAANTVYWDGAHLAALRAETLQNDPRYREVFTRLRKNAEISRKRGPYSVMDKEDVPPSGDKHDYLSYARYWWPNPNTKDGLPYVRRDGKTNEELARQGRSRADRQDV